MGLGPDESPGAVFVGELAEVRFALRVVVLAQTAFEVVSVADVESSGGVLEDIDVKHGV